MYNPEVNPSSIDATPAPITTVSRLEQPLKREVPSRSEPFPSMCAVSRPVQPDRALESSTPSDVGVENDLSDVQFANADAPMLVSDAENDTDAREEHPANVEGPIVLADERPSPPASDEQPLNADTPTDSTLPSEGTSTRPEQPLNALSSMLVTAPKSPSTLLSDAHW